MTYYYIWGIIAYPLFLFGILCLDNDNLIGFGMIVIAIIFLLIKDVLICQRLREKELGVKKK